jgi:hypothetical protein
MRREEEEFYTSFFDGKTTLESKIQALEDIGATKEVNIHGVNQLLLTCQGICSKLIRAELTIQWSSFLMDQLISTNSAVI